MSGNVTALKTQGEIPGTERRSIPEVDQATRDYLAHRDERMALESKERQARFILEQRMDQHNLHKYVYVDGELEYEVYEPDRKEGKRFKVRKISGSKDEE